MPNWVPKKTLMDGASYWYEEETGQVAWTNPAGVNEEGEQVEWTWVPHPTDFWQPAKIVARNADRTVVCQTEAGEEVVIPSHREVQDATTAGRLQKVPLWKLSHGELDHPEEDLIMLENVNDGSIIWNLRVQYAKGSLYTWVGASHRVLVSINPYQRLPLYGDDQIALHRDKSPNIDVAPHIFDIANDSYDEMLFEGKHQSILISGESGAGKTEATKQCLKFWAKVAGSKNGVEERLIQANPVLEAFGNAKTIRNNNSSRFGKWMEVYFHVLERSIDGALIINYLLEKSRLVYQQSGERNFHIFYQLMADAGARDAYQLKGAADNRYTQKGLTAAVPGIDDAADFKDAKKAMVDLEFTEQEQEWALRIPAAILHLGNVTFEAQGMANNVQGSKVSDDAPLALAAKYLDLPIDELRKVLVTRSISVNRETSTIPLDPAGARGSCDSIAKGVYSRFFDWLVGRCNQALKGDTTGKFLGVLDIFGFEIFDVNSFEQLCINYCNEKLQQLFNIETFRDEEALYVQQGIPFETIKFIDSEPVLNMIESPPRGILLALDDECKLPEGDDFRFMSKIEDSFSGYPNFQTDPKRKFLNMLSFEIIHYAGVVRYTADDFMTKNKDTFFQDAYDAMGRSSHPLTKAIFPTAETRLQVKSLSSVFRQQLSVLMNKLETTSTRYVRCIKPNENMAPLQFDAPLVMRQLRYSGVFEAVSIRKQGYPFRYTYEAFSFRFRAINPDHIYQNEDPRKLSEEIINQCSTKLPVTYGSSMILYRAPTYKLLKLLRNLALEKIIPRIQSVFRRVLPRVLRAQLAKAEKQIADAMASVTDYNLIQASLDAIDANLGPIVKKHFGSFRPRGEPEAKAQLQLLSQWLAEEKKLEAVLAKDPNKNFLEYIAARDSAAALEHIPKTQKQKDLVAKLVDQIENCEIGKLDTKFQDARKRMDKAAMEELLGKATEWNHQSPAVDEVKRVLALPERQYIDLELIAAKEMGDAARAKQCVVRIWELDGMDARAEKARREMNKPEMETMVGKANEIQHFPDSIQEIQRVLKLPEKEYLALEQQAGEEMGDAKRVRRCKGRLLEIEMSELSASYARWDRYGRLRQDPNEYGKGKWFGKAAVVKAYLCAEKVAVQNAISKNDDPIFKKQAKTISTGILAYLGIKNDPRGPEQAIFESFTIASQSEDLKVELAMQLLKWSTPNSEKPTGGSLEKAWDLLGVFVYYWVPEPELFKTLYTVLKKRGRKFELAAAHGKFDVAPNNPGPRSPSEIARVINEVNSMDAGNAVALQ